MFRPNKGNSILKLWKFHKMGPNVFNHWTPISIHIFLNSTCKPQSWIVVLVWLELAHNSISIGNTDLQDMVRSVISSTRLTTLGSIKLWVLPVSTKITTFTWLIWLNNLIVLGHGAPIMALREILGFPPLSLASVSIKLIKIAFENRVV